MTRRRGVIAAGVFGFGFSGLVDVVVLHHVLQLHFLLSNVVPPDTTAALRTNIRADGLFSLVMVVVAGIGAGLLWQAERRTAEPLPFKRVVGAAVVGLGTFDLFDVVVNHWVLGLHHATHGGGNYDPWWAVVSVLIVVAGIGLYAAGGRATAVD